MVLCYKITHKYKELLPFLLYLMIASIYYENVQFLDLFGKSIQFIDILERTAKYFFQKIATRLMNICIH